MKSKLIPVALMMLVAEIGSQAQDRRPTPTAGGTDATSSHGQKTESSTNKAAMGAGSNTLTAAGSGKKPATGQSSGQSPEKRGSKTSSRQVNQQAAGVPGSRSGKQKQ